MGMYLHLIRKLFQLVFVPNSVRFQFRPEALMCCGRLFHSLYVLGKKEWSWESTEDWGICRLCWLCLVTLPTGMRSSRGISMAPALALKNVMSLDLALRSERGCHDRVFMFLAVFPFTTFWKYKNKKTLLIYQARFLEKIQKDLVLLAHMNLIFLQMTVQINIRTNRGSREIGKGSRKMKGAREQGCRFQY